MVYAFTRMRLILTRIRRRKGAIQERSFVMDDEYVTIPKETLSKILDNEVISKEHDAKIMIENSITNRCILCTGLIIVG